MRKFKKLVYIWMRSIKNYRDDKFIEKLFNVGKSSTSFIFGKKIVHSSNTIVYLIDIDTYKAGFCAILRNLLSAMFVADSFHWIPYVNINNSIYSVPDGFNGKMNMFEYFFKNPIEAKLNEIKRDFNYFEYELPHRELLDNTYLSDRKLVAGYEVTDEYLNQLAILCKKYFCFNDETKIKLEDDVCSMLKGKRTIGIHVRGTDFKNCEKGHPTYVQWDQYISVVREILKQPYDQIFLATDEEKVVEVFEKEFPGKIVYYVDVFRSSNGEAVHMQKNTRENNEYYLGWEILRDMYTLSCCDALVAGISQVSIMARVFKISRDEKYLDTLIISNGINN